MKPCFITFIVFSLTAAQACLPHSVDEPKSAVDLPPRIDSAHPRPHIVHKQDEKPTYDDPSVALEEFRRFWHTFADPNLERLIHSALSYSFDLRASLARIEKARAIAGQQAAARFPTASISGSAGIARAINPAIGSIDAQSAGVSLPIRYEADLFAKYRAAHNAAELEAEASEWDWLALRITLASEVAESWYDLVYAHLQQKLINEQQSLNKDYHELLKGRVDKGLSPQVDAFQQEQLLWQSVANVKSTAIDFGLAEQRLQLLVVRWPQGGLEKLKSFIPDVLPQPKARKALTITGQLLFKRPDLQAARLRVKAADYQVGSAVADYFPSLSFSFAPGAEWLRVETSQGSREVSGFVYSAAANLEFPLFDGFLRAEKENENDATLKERIEQLNQATLAALIEARSALLQEQGVREVLNAKQNEASAARKALHDAQARYKLGVTDFVPVLLALQTEQRVSLELLALQRQLISYRIALHRALAAKLPQ